jgi:hypothetical protein
MSQQWDEYATFWEFAGLAMACPCSVLAAAGNELGCS